MPVLRYILLRRKTTNDATCINTFLRQPTAARLLHLSASSKFSKTHGANDRNRNDITGKQKRQKYIISTKYE